MKHTSTERAVVLGAGIGGLLAARAAADRHEDVVIIERDRLSDEPTPRRGVPQGRHIHLLLPRGYDLLERFFPGLMDELVAGGAHRADLLANGRACLGGHRFQQGRSDLTALGVTRPALETAIRRRVAALSNVMILDGQDVVGLVGTAERVSGARLVARRDGSAVVDMAADLVVDACGRGPRTAHWLRALGLGSPPEEVLRVGVGYATRMYRLAPGALGADVTALSAPAPGHPRGGGLTLVEGDRAIVTLMGVLGDVPPTEPEAFLDFASDLALPDIHEVISAAPALTDPVGQRHPTSTFTRYDRMKRFPQGLAVVGDAVCSLNPVYGQGMTVAALEAEALGRHLARAAFDSRVFQAEVGRIAAVAWSLARGADLAFPEVEGKRTAMSRVMGRYVGRIQAGAANDSRLGAAFLRVSSLVDPPTALLRPSTLIRVVSAGAADGSRAEAAGRG